MSSKTVHCIINGHVQGVFFRLNTRNKARELELDGWVRNCSNGDVELKASGSEQQLRELLDWLPQGVPSATVDGVACKFIAYESLSEFDVIASC